jgi:hypothetical protein
MKKIIILITIILTFYQVLQSQTLEKSIIDKKLELQGDAVYVVNGLPYEQKDSLKLNSVLKSFSLDHLVELTKLKNDGGIVRCTSKDIAIVYFATQQTNKEINNKLKIVKDKFPDKYFGYSQHILTDSKNPVLIIDNKTVHHTEAKEIIEKIKTNDIFFIDFKTEPQSSEFYGQNAKNGLVRIWTK